MAGIAHEIPRSDATTATNKTIELATATAMPVRLRGCRPVAFGSGRRRVAPIPRLSRPRPGIRPEVGAVLCQAAGPLRQHQISRARPTQRGSSLSVRFSTLKRRRVSKLTGSISTACRRVRAASPVGSSWWRRHLGVVDENGNDSNIVSIQGGLDSSRTKSSGSSMRLTWLASAS